MARVELERLHSIVQSETIYDFSIDLKQLSLVIISEHIMSQSIPIRPITGPANAVSVQKHQPDKSNP